MGSQPLGTHKAQSGTNSRVPASGVDQRSVPNRSKDACSWQS